MHLNETIIGQKANLLLKWHSQTLELNTTIVGMTDKGPLIKPYRYRGEIITFTDLNKTNITMDLYYTNPVNSERVGWTNVALRRVEQEGNPCYQVMPNVMGALSHNAERRNNPRIPLGFPGTVTDRVSKESHNVDLDDINNGGIAFSISAEDDKNLSNDIEISFSDKVRETTYKVRIDCKIIRREHSETNTVCGCRIVKPSKTSLMYIYLKYVEYMANRKQL